MTPLSFADCETVAREHGSPFYVLHPDAFVRNFRALERAFRGRYERVRIGYSYKTNYVPHLCRLAKDLGGHAEVVSRLEYDLALRVGHAPATILFNGPVKSREDVELALAGGSLVNLDSPYELDHVRAFAARHPGSAARVGVRVNMSLEDGAGASHVQEGLEVGRFGFPAEALPAVVSTLAGLGLRVSALHGHASSSSRGTWIYERIAGTLCRLAEELMPDTVEEIDVGGGFFGPMPPGLAPPGAPSFDDYAEAIVGTLARSAWARARRPWLVLEPGVALAADALSFVTRVLDVKEIRGRVLAVVDGSVLHVKPSMHRRNQPHRVIREDGARGAGERQVSVTGATCMEKDYLLRDVAADVARGDYLRIDNVGAYSVVMSPPFIHAAPAIVTRQRGRFLAARRRETFDHLFECYLMEPAGPEEPC
jgi:diaminopimelate decarboxylase